MVSGLHMRAERQPLSASGTAGLKKRSLKGDDAAQEKRRLSVIVKKNNPRKRCQSATRGDGFRVIMHEIFL